MRVVSLFDGIACGYEALKRAGIPVTSYLAFEIDKHAIQIAKKNHPDIVHMGSVVDFPFWMLNGADLVIGGSPCFVAGTKVICKDAYKNIEDVKVGDEVLTHRNRYRKVLRVGNTVAPTYMVKAQGMKPTETTAEHPYYVREMRQQWDRVERMSVRVWGEPIWKPASDLKKDDFVSSPILPVSQSGLDINKEEAYVLGRYLADGHTTKHMKGLRREHHRNWQMILSIGHSKVAEFEKKVTLKHHLQLHTTSVVRAVFCSKRLVEIAEKEIGCGAFNKNISMNILNLDKSILAEFLQGYLDGDGCEKDGVVRATSISESLIQTLALCVAKVYGTIASYEYSECPKTTGIEGRIVNQRNTYTTSFRKELRKQSNFMREGDHLWSRFKSVEPTGQVKQVFNLEVEEDNSYTANNVVVHNCQGFSFAGKQLAFDDPRSKLFFEFVRAIREINPKHYLLENVKMKKEHEAVITQFMGVNPVEINSALLSAQNRRRLYWANWKIEQPEDRGILLKDIIEDGITDRDKSYCIDVNYWKGGNLEQYFEKSRRQLVFNERKANCLRARCNNEVLSESGVERVLDKKIGNMVFGAVQRGRYLVDGKRQDPEMKVAGLTEQRIELGGEKSNALTSVKKDSLVFIGGFEQGRRLHDGKGKSRNYSEGYRVYSAEGKAASLTAQSKGGLGGATGLYMTEQFTIRKLTPVECERLQTLPDGYTDIVEKELYMLYNTLGISSEMILCNVKSMDANGKYKLIDMAKFALCTIKDMRDIEVLSYQKGRDIQTQSVNIVIDKLGKKEAEQEDYVIDITRTGYDMDVLYTQIEYALNSGHEAMKKGLLVKTSTDLLWRITSEENLKEMRLFTILTAIKLIIDLRIYTFVKTRANMQFFIENLNVSPESFLNVELSNLKITTMKSSVSNSQRYKALGNGWTVDVIAHIFKNLIDSQN